MEWCKFLLLPAVAAALCVTYEVCKGVLDNWSADCAAGTDFELAKLDAADENRTWRKKRYPEIIATALLVNLAYGLTTLSL